jgi:hypothetical protein
MMNFIYNIFGIENNKVNKVNFEDVQNFVKHRKKHHILVNVLDVSEQRCLIKGTLPINDEINIINSNLKNINLKIIIYAKNSNENRLIDKYHQLLELGFVNVYIYPGGLFEWLLLQDIYGSEEFPTTTGELDILKYKPMSAFNNLLLTDID